MIFFSSKIEVVLIGLFVIITFSFSIFEKILNWEFTRTYYQNHFKSTIIKDRVSSCVILVLFFEIISLVVLLFGFFEAFRTTETILLKFGFLTTAVTFLILLIGQRIAKDYQGAMSITVYFILTVLGIYFLK